MSNNPSSQSGQPVLLTTFFVRNALCALDAAGIQEVIRVGAVTLVHHAPEEIVGIVNLRGKIVTILDLGMRLGFPKIAEGAERRIFIMEDRGEFIGLLVDRVAEVIEVESENWQPPPANVAWGQARFFKGICRESGQVITVLDPRPVLAECAA